MDRRKIKVVTQIHSFIGDGSDPYELDVAIIYKGPHSNSLVIAKLGTYVAAFDGPDLKNEGKLFALNYKNCATTDEAYSKMMKWIGKMAKKSSNDRYFQHKDPYGYQDMIDYEIWNSRVIEEIRRKMKQ